MTVGELIEALGKNDKSLQMALMMETRDRHGTPTGASFSRIKTVHGIDSKADGTIDEVLIEGGPIDED